MAETRVTVIPGDGIGPDIIDATLRLLGALDQDVAIPLDQVGPDGMWSDLMPFGRARIAQVADELEGLAAVPRAEVHHVQVSAREVARDVGTVVVAAWIRRRVKNQRIMPRRRSVVAPAE